MIAQLSEINAYFDQPYAVFYEEELVKHFGREPVTSAIKNGLIQHRWVPCGNLERRCVCWLKS